MQNTLDPHVFRKTLGRFATGITIVTTTDSGGVPHGLTANSFTSVSLSPPLVLFCLGKGSTNLAAFLEAKSFAVNVLSDGQEALSARFASSKIANRFEGVEWSAGVTGSPLLPGTLATFDCRKHSEVDAGDHYVLIGEVQTASMAEGEPLLYFASQYRRLA